MRSDKPWKLYNDTAPGAQSNQAPTLMRTMPDGSKRAVKFDGVRGDYLIDRKWSIRNLPRARAQALRQSQALAESRVIGIWEVPNTKQQFEAVKLLKQVGITNIIVRISKP